PDAEVARQLLLAFRADEERLVAGRLLHAVLRKLRVARQIELHLAPRLRTHRLPLGLAEAAGLRRPEALLEPVPVLLPLGDQLAGAHLDVLLGDVADVGGEVADHTQPVARQDDVLGPRLLRVAVAIDSHRDDARAHGIDHALAAAVAHHEG